MPEYYNTFISFKYKIQQLDFFRYLAVYYYGGIYLDLDMDIDKSFNDLDQSICQFPIEIMGEDDILVGNYAFYAPKGDPFIKHIIDCIVNKVITNNEIQDAQKYHTDPKEHVYVYFTTGPELVTRAYYTYTDRDNVRLLTSQPQMNDCFGDYGKHYSYGSWKYVTPDTTIMK
jgi:mannosyltransferase OCH1-like enzyme